MDVKMFPNDNLFCASGTGAVRCPPPSPQVAGIWNNANFSFHQPGPFTGFWVVSSWTHTHTWWHRFSTDQRQAKDMGGKDCGAPLCFRRSSLAWILWHSRVWSNLPFSAYFLKHLVHTLSFRHTHTHTHTHTKLTAICSLLCCLL